MADKLKEEYRAAMQVAYRNDDFNNAATMFEQAFAEAPEETGTERALKAAVAFECGSCLLRAHDLWDVPLSRMTAQQIDVAIRARKFWHEDMRLYNSLDSSSAGIFDKDLAIGAREIVLNAPLMKGENLAYQAHRLAPGGDQTVDKEGAVELFGEALKFLDARIPDHQNLIRLAHRRLVVLCNDTGREQEAAEHAKWVLANEKDLDTTSRMMMEMASGRTPGEVMSSSSRCFIATAAFESSSAAEVGVLRAFRDHWMRSSAIGRVSIAFYELLSPPLARFISTHRTARKAARLPLRSLIIVARLFLRPIRPPIEGGKGTERLLD